ncbi:TULIP family P47-like protein [Proteus sp. PR00224]|uniref:TULIP family P47-like protein n=1 Tax=Proteus sp. PR00224 TaxID=2794026 RepID=UPI0018E47C7C|nr:TULIP family P47-like protein [Proteus sp. PR00224]MBI6338205.1 TULIP family P47-like protein [Proteus sp. PR00224]
MNNSVSTFGWDTAYLASFPIVNKAIMVQKSFPSTFDYKDATDITISGHWESWQLIPAGAGGDVQLKMKQVQKPPFQVQLRVLLASLKP